MPSTIVTRRGGWIVDVLLGGLVGGVVAGVAAVNLVIYSGIEGGYEATIPAVFRQNPVIGGLTVIILAAGPALGIATARRARRLRASQNGPPA